MKRIVHQEEDNRHERAIQNSAQLMEVKFLSYDISCKLLSSINKSFTYTKMKPLYKMK